MACLAVALDCASLAWAQSPAPPSKEPAQSAASSASSSTAASSAPAAPAPGSRAADAATSSSGNPLAPFIHPLKVDAFNPRANGSQAAAAKKPRRGGTLTIRTPAEFGGLNPILTTSRDDQGVIRLLFEPLMRRDPETFEYRPRLAWSWDEQDIVIFKDGRRATGVIVERTDAAIRFAEGATRRTFNKCDLAQIVPAGPKSGVTLAAQWGGATLLGAVTQFVQTARIDTSRAPNAAITTIPISDLATYEVAVGSRRETRPAAKPYCLFRFYLRPGIQWQDGQPITAEDCVFAFEAVRNPQIKDAASLRSYLVDLEGVRSLEEGRVVEFTWQKPYFKALEMCNGEDIPPLPRHIFKPETFAGDPTAFAEAFAKNEFKQKPLGSGAYRIEEWRSDRLSIVRNPSYYASKIGLPDIAPEQPYLDRIVWVVINNPLAAVKEMQKGAIDLDGDVEEFAWVAADTNTPEFTSHVVRALHTGLLYTYISWNADRPWFRDPQVRRALAMLVPAERIKKDIHYDLAEQVNGPFFIDGPIYDKSLPPIPYDPREARRILRKAGWLDRNGDGILENEVEIEENGQKARKTVDMRFEYLIHSARQYHEQIANIIKEEFGKAGIAVSIRKLEFATFAQVVQDRNFDACRFAWGSQIDEDPFQIWHSSQAVKGGSNYSNFRNAKCDALLEAAREEFDAPRRWAMYRQVGQILYDEQPACFLFAFKELFFYNAKIRGVKIYSDQYPLNYSEWWMDE